MLEQGPHELIAYLLAAERAPLERLPFSECPPGTIVRLTTESGNRYLVEFGEYDPAARMHNVRVFREKPRALSRGVGYLGEFVTTQKEFRVGEQFVFMAKCTSPVAEIAAIGIVAHTGFIPS